MPSVKKGVKGQMMNSCRFENAVMAAEKASQIDPRCNEVAMLHNTVTLVARARARGNDLYKSERYTEASSAYAEGLRLDPCNAILYCNRAACWFKLGMWERSIEDCNQALRYQPCYTKPLLRRAASNSKVHIKPLFRLSFTCNLFYSDPRAFCPTVDGKMGSRSE